MVVHGKESVQFLLKLLVKNIIPDDNNNNKFLFSVTVGKENFACKESYYIKKK